MQHQGIRKPHDKLSLKRFLKRDIGGVSPYRGNDLKFLSRTWFKFDVVWALSLVAVGVFGISGVFSPQ